MITILKKIILLSTRLPIIGSDIQRIRMAYIRLRDKFRQPEYNVSPCQCHSKQSIDVPAEHVNLLISVPVELRKLRRELTALLKQFEILDNKIKKQENIINQITNEKFELN